MIIPPVPITVSPIGYSQQGSIWLPDPTSPITWLQSTLTIPSEPEWTAPAQHESGWVMGYESGAGLTAYTQIGWIDAETPQDNFGSSNLSAGTPTLFVETNTVNTFLFPLTPGRSYNVAVSCDLGTDNWHDWFMIHGRWKMIASPTLAIGCTQASYARANEEFTNGDTPLSNDGVFSDLILDEI